MICAGGDGKTEKQNGNGKKKKGRGKSSRPIGQGVKDESKRPKGGGN